MPSINAEVASTAPPRIGLTSALTMNAKHQPTSPVTSPASSTTLANTNTQSRLSAIALAAIGLFASGAQAQDAGGAATATQIAAANTGAALESVVITASRSQTKVEDMALYTTVVSREQIESSAALTLDQLLRDIPGVNLGGTPFYSSDPTGHQLKIRGATNSKVLMLLDGVPIHDPFYSTIQWYKLPLSAIERIEIIRGGNSSLWGNMAVLGVVNVVTKRAQGDGGSASLSLGNLGTVAAALSKNMQASDALRFRLSADTLKTDGYNTAPVESRASFPGRGSSADSIYNLSLTTYWSPSADLNGYARAGIHQQDETINGYTYGMNRQTSPDFAAGLTKNLDSRSLIQANVWSQYVAFDKYNGAGCYLQANGTTCNSTAPSASVVDYFAQRDRNTYRELGGSTYWSTTLKGLFTNAQVGVDYRAISGQDAADVYNVPNGPSIANSALNRQVYGQGHQRFAAVFGQLKAQPTDAFDVTLSARYDSWSNTEGVSQLTKASTNATTGGPVAGSSKTSFNPSLALRYAFTDELSGRAAAYRSFRAPGLNNMYRSFSSSTSITIANPNLEPETMSGGEVGLDWRGASSQLGATLFSYQVKNMIASYQIANVSVAPAEVLAVCGSAAFNAAGSNCPATVNLNSNGQDGRTQGLELSGHSQVARGLSADGGYTWTRAIYTNTTTGDPVHTQLPAVPRGVWVAGLNTQATPELRLGAQLRYTQGMWLNMAETVRQGGFTVLNLSADYAVRKTLRLGLAVANAGDRVYSDGSASSLSARSMSLPRTVVATLRSEF
jgi:iron complex outermembrane receptor protein